MLVFSCHADTNFRFHSLKRDESGHIKGHLDNFIGVHAMMKAYFSGRLDKDYVRIELTYGEEKDYAGALEVLQSLKKSDVVIVVDVTATESGKDLVFEKCRSRKLQTFLERALKDIPFDLYDHCPDPIAWEDEVDVYQPKCRNTCFMGIRVWGGDYNEGAVCSDEHYIDQFVEAICRIVEEFPRHFKTRNSLNIPVQSR
jgi:hypothetical protein